MPAEGRPVLGVSLRRALLLATLTGLLLGASQIDLWPLAWISLAPLALACHGRSGGAGFALGFLAGLLAGSATYGTISYGWLIYAMILGYCGVFMGLFGWVHARLFGRVGLWADLLLPALAWTAFEFLRRLGSVSFPIDLAATQAQLLPLLQIARWTGGHGVSFLVALPSGLLATWALRQRVPAAAVLALLLPIAGALGYGTWALSQPEETGPELRVAAVQPAFHNWIYDLELVSPPHRRLLEDTIFGLSELAATQGAELIVWPETALHERVLDDPRLRGRVAALTRRGAAVLAGFFRENDLGLEHNSAVLFQPDGQIHVYDKRRLASLAEWRLSPGERNAPMVTSVGRLGILICLESIYPQDVRALVAQGAEVLVVTTNDAGFLYSPMAGFHGHRSVLRAVEAGRWLIHLGQAGPSYLFDPQGRARVETPLFQEAILEGQLRRLSGETPYQRWGDWFAGLMALGLVAIEGRRWWGGRARA